MTPQRFILGRIQVKFLNVVRGRSILRGVAGEERA